MVICTERHQKSGEKHLFEPECFKELVDHSREGIFVTRGGRFKYCNTQLVNFCGYSIDQLYSMPAVELFILDDQQEFESMCSRVFSGSIDSCCSALRLRTMEGQPILVEVYADRITWHGEAALHCSIRVCVQEEEQGRRQKKIENTDEAQLLHNNKIESIGTLAGGIAHDFNNILAAILGFADLAKESVPPGSQVEKDLEMVIESGNRATDLVEQILAICRRKESKRMPLKIDSILKETLKLLRATVPTTIDIRQHVSADCEKIIGDPAQVHQIIMNLCINAYHAMQQQGGVMKVSLTPVKVMPAEKNRTLKRKPGKYMCLAVKDTGHGIDDVVLENIFTPYFTTKKRRKGTGLGLAIVKSIITSYGGWVKVETKVGQGSTFQVFFPVAARSKRKEVSYLNNGHSCGGSEHILYVDDEDHIVTAGKRLLERLGYTVTTSTDSAKAYDIFCAKQDEFDLVITDMTMPKTTGDELTRGILRKKPNLPVIISSGYSDRIDEQKAKKIGAQEFIMKPVRIGELARVVRRVLDDCHKFDLAGNC